MNLLNNRKFVTYAAIGLIVAVVLYFVYRKYRKRPGQDKPAADGTQYSSPLSQLCQYDDRFPLRYGSCGSNVKALQTALGGLTVDGKFGLKTETRLQITTGSKTIDQAGLEKLLSSDPGGTSTLTVTAPVLTDNLTVLVQEIRTDDKALRIAPRSGTEPWVQAVLNLNDTQLGKLADLYTTTYKESLYTVVDEMYFAFTTDADVKIMARLESVGKKAV